MSTITDQLMANARMKPIRHANCVRNVTRTETGVLLVEQNSGQQFTIAADDELFQAFVVYTMLADYAQGSRP
jgi:hypothetical protein